ncbi:MAG: DUF2339 domain-containing protein [Gemmatimonadaceae bacterium]
MILLWVVVLLGLVLAFSQAFDRVRRLEHTVDELRRTIDRLTRRLDEGTELRAAPAVRPVAKPIGRYEPPSIRQRALEPQPPAPEKEAVPAAAAPEKEQVVALDRPPGTPPTRHRAALPEPALALRSFDWEALIGVKFFAIVAGIALLLAGAFFVSYSKEHGWLTPTIQFAIGIAAAIACLVLGELKVSRRYAWTADALDAAGIALLYVVFFAAFARWHFIGPIASFTLFALTTVVAVLLAIRHASLFIALLGLIGGFASPAIIATGQDNPVGLFGYLLLLNAGLAWVAYKKEWPLLTTLSLGLTTLYQWGWVSKFLTVGKVPLAAAIFLVFPLMSFVAFAFSRPKDGLQRSTKSLFAHGARVGAVIPVFFSLYLAAVPAYGARYGVLFGFLFCISVGLFAVAIFQGPRLLHLLGAGSAVIVFAIWMAGSYDQSAWPGFLVAVAVFVLFYLVAPLTPSLAFVRRRAGEIQLGDLASRAVLAAPLLLFVFPALAFVEPRTASPALLFTVLLALLGACSAYAITRREGIVHFLAAFFAVGAEAAWSAKYLTPARLLPALAIYGVFGLFFIGAPVVARRRGAPLTPQGAGAALALVSIALLFFLAGGAVAQAALWGIALLLAILTAGLFAESSATRNPLFAIAGTALAWLVLALWWTRATVSVALVPALSIVGGYALLTIAGSIWAMRGAESDEATRGIFRNGAFVALVGHLFLLFVASQPALAIPPWPLLAVLGLLTAAAGVGALYVKRGELFLATVIATAAVILVWQLGAPAAQWQTIAIGSAAALVALAACWMVLARGAGAEDRHFLSAATAASLGAQFIAMAAAGHTAAPSLALLLLAQLGFVAATLGFASRDLPRLEMMTVLAVLPAAGAGFVWMAPHNDASLWSAQLALTVPLYLVFIAYPLVLGRRAGAARAPYLATVLASVLFFFQARSSIDLGGYGAFIGALPIVEAALLALVLADLVRLERSGEPRSQAEIARLALVAGASLGFVTLAIPLQLERNWITIGWAVEAAALAWLYQRIPHKGLLWFTFGLCAAVFIRLGLNPEVLHYEPRGALRIWNWYLYTYAVCSAALLIAGRVLVRTDDRLQPQTLRLSSLLPAGAVILLFLLLNIEIADFYAAGPAITFDFFSSALAQDLTYTLGWALFAVALLGAGIYTHSKPGRITAIVLLSIAMGKCAFHDLWRLGGLYRVGSLVGIAACALLITVALQKFVLTSRPEPSEALS